MKVKKAIIPVAGKGTRFLPATKETPKEMLPILNTPMIHYVVEEAVHSGIEEIIFVTSSGKSSIENYFDRNKELELFLDNVGKTEALRLIKSVGEMIKVHTVRQKEQLGLGHAIAAAKTFINKDETFAVLLGDDIIQNSEIAVTKQLINISSKNDSAAVIGVMEVPLDKTHKYGIVDGEKKDDRLLLMSRMVEKPHCADAPTRLATPGRYILNQRIFKILDDIPKGAGGEYQLTDAINLLAQQEQVYAYEFYGTRYDTGSLEGYLEATIDFALKDKALESFARDLLMRKTQSFN